MKTDAHNWSPFPVVNGQRTVPSQELLNKKRHTPTKVDLSDIPTAPY